jgi:hypothetical protein
VKDFIFWGKEKKIRCCLNPFMINNFDREVTSQQNKKGK